MLSEMQCINTYRLATPPSRIEGLFATEAKFFVVIEIVHFIVNYAMTFRIQTLKNVLISISAIFSAKSISSAKFISSRVAYSDRYTDFSSRVILSRDN